MKRKSARKDCDTQNKSSIDSSEKKSITQKKQTKKIHILNLLPREKNKNVHSKKTSSKNNFDNEIKKPDIKNIEKPQDIKDAVTALQENISEKVIDFDDALKKLKNIEKLKNDEDIVYIGSGNFAVIAYTKAPSGKQTLEIRRTIEFEPHHNAIEWREKLSYDINTIQGLNPVSISELYTNKEKQSFPNFSGKDISVS